jgi:hypothetical protein
MFFDSQSWPFLPRNQDYRFPSKTKENQIATPKQADYNNYLRALSSGTGGEDVVGTDSGFMAKIDGFSGLFLKD